MFMKKINNERRRFSVYEHHLVLSDGQLITRKFIVLRDLGTHTIVSYPPSFILYCHSIVHSSP